MRILVLFFAVFTGAFSIAQQDSIVLKSFVRNDSVLLRWSPTSADMMLEGLRKGYIIQRIETDFANDASHPTQEFIIEPFEKRRVEFENSTDEEIRHLVEFVSDLLKQTNLADASKNMAFAVLSLGASTNRTIARLLGLFFQDSLKDSYRYTYRILLRDTSVKSNAVVVTSSVISLNSPLSTLNGSSAQPKLKQVYLSWEAQSLQGNYAAYNIERSDDSIHFSRLNKLPYYFLKSKDEPDKTSCDFADTTVLEARIYYYRITGINHFADTGKSSNVVKVYVPRSLVGSTSIDSISANGFERIVYAHFGSSKKNNAPEKMVLMRSDSLLFGYSVIAEEKFPVNYSHHFTFKTSVPVESGDRYYYKAATVGEDGDTLLSYPFYFFTLDQIPPSIPLDLKGTINDSGIVHLSWKPNADKDIRGYRVYRSNSLKEEFTEVSRVFCTDAVFTDTLRLNNLTSEVFYSVSAVDLNYNNSELCKPFKLLKPDTIAPVPAVFKHYETTTTGVELTWANSSSADVKTHLLIRQHETQTDTLARWHDETKTWKDTTGVAGTGYHYRIVVSDQSDNTSVSESLFIHYETGLRPGVKNLKGLTNREQQKIELNWDLPQGDIYSIQIYRAKNDGNFVLYKTLRDSKTIMFADENLSINNTYQYKIKVIYKNGTSSGLSEVVSITY